MISKLEQVISLSSTAPLMTKLIKIISTLLITCAIIWELGNLYARLNGLLIFPDLTFIFWIDRFVLTAHFLEALFATYYASLKGKNPLKYSIYTFFVGTVSLLELKTEESGK